MSIILNRRSAPALRLESVGFASETELQEYIASNPTCIPMDEIEEGLRLVVLGREFPTNSGPVDVLAMDSAGAPYLIETKLYANGDKRRVVAQVLDYGAALWASGGDAVFSAIERFAGQNGQSLSDRVREVLALSHENAQQAVSALKTNLAEGKFKFVVLMDEVDDRLKDLILFLNESSSFETFAVELDVYRHEDLQIVIPRVFGAQTRKRTAQSRRWDEASLGERVSELDLPQSNRRLLAWAIEFGKRLEQEAVARVTFGSGNRPQAMVRTANNTVYLAGVSKGSTSVHLNLPMMEWKADATAVDKALAELSGALNTEIRLDRSVFRFPIQDALLAQRNYIAVERAFRMLVEALT